MKVNRFRAVLLASSIVLTGLVMGARYLGMLQSWELQAFDQLMGLRPDEYPDSRILVVTIDESDISQNQDLIGGEISDFALNKVLEEVENINPRAIGLDIYHDFPAKQKDLANRFANNSDLVTVCKVPAPAAGDAGVAAPPGVPAERQGFSDVLQDPDGVTRRHLLAMDVDPASPCAASYAFSVQLAMRYLSAEGFEPKASPEGFLQIGDVVFKPMKARTGGYQKFAHQGHQVLLNYRSPRGIENIAAQISLTQVLQGKLKKVQPDVVKERIILIGTTGGSFGDLWLTPYSRMNAQQLPGVLLQAQMVSQILSAVMDRRPLIWVFPAWGEILWVFGWSFAGGMLAWRFRSPLLLGIVMTSGCVILYGVCYVFLVQSGCWVPLVPSVIALVATSGSVAAWHLNHKFRHRAWA